MGFESCHPAVNFLFFAAVIYGSVAFQHPVFLAISCLCAFAFSMKRNGKRAVIFNLCLLPLVACFALYYSSYHHFGVTVLKQNFIGNNLTVESFVYGMVTGTAGGGSVHVAELPVPGGVQRQGAVPVRQGQPTAVAVSHNFAALYSENRPGGKKNQPGSEGHRPGKQSGKCFSTTCQLPADFLHADHVDDLRTGAGIRLHAFPGQSASGTDGIFHLPLRQPGQGVRDRAVFRHHPDCHGGDPWGDDDVLQSQNHLEAIGKRKRSDRRRLRRAVSAAHGTGILDGVPVSEGKTESIMFGSHHTKT